MSTTRSSHAADFRGCPCAGETLDKLIQPAILVALATGPIHGYRLTEQIGQMAMFGGSPPDISGVYRFLKAMEKKGLVASSWRLSDSGPAKKSYRIAAAGRRCLARWIGTLEAYRQGIDELIDAARKATPRTPQKKSKSCCSTPPA